MAKPRPRRVKVDKPQLAAFHTIAKGRSKDAMRTGEVKVHQGVRFIKINQWIIPLGQEIEPAGIRDKPNAHNLTFTRFQEQALAKKSGWVGNWKGHLFVRTGAKGFEYLHRYARYRSLEEGHVPYKPQTN
jgi:hypothetical protein